MKRHLGILFLTGLLAFTGPVAAGKLAMTAPSSVGQQLKEDRATRSPTPGLSELLAGYDRWKDAFVRTTGFNYGIDYNALYMKAAVSPTRNDDSASGVIRFYTDWTLLQRGEDRGSLVVKLEHRHAFTSVAPNAFGFEIGYDGLLHSTFSDQGFHATNLYWKQTFDSKRLLLFTGFMDVTDYVDVHLLASPWTSFSNLVFATGSGTIGSLPDGALGAMLGGWLDDNLYLSAGIADANADAGKLFDGFDSFFNKFETFKSVELGWSPNRQSLFFHNVHLTLWQVDRRKDAGARSGWGVALSSSSTHGKNWMSFLRGGWSDDGNALLEASISIGGARLMSGDGDTLGIGLNWGRPNHIDYPDARKDQWTMEAYWLFQLGRHLQLTPSVQFIVNPALDHTHDTNTVVGLRARTVF
ncbi:carbohydrate porin [Sulfurivirga sp.]|uniref:carbohydrate porin n=1 Tax=Sulfurivirga sp. TaxID=2614236 RepID=UPI0025D55317|nr:carbohydrate porin [Sulfurivirga sp.]